MNIPAFERLLSILMMWFSRLFGYSMFMVAGAALVSDRNVWNMGIAFIGAVILGHLGIRDGQRIEREELT